MNEKTKNGWYIAGSSGSDEVSCVAFYLDDDVRKHIADADEALTSFNHVEGRFCTVSVGLDLSEIFFLNVPTKKRLMKLFPKMSDADFVKGVGNNQPYIDFDSVVYAGSEFNQDELKKGEEFDTAARVFEIDENFITISAIGDYSDDRVSSCDIFKLFENEDNAKP